MTSPQPGSQSPESQQPGAEQPEPTPEPAASRGPQRRHLVLGGLAAAAMLAGSTRLTWIQALAPDLAGTPQSIPVLGGDAAPAVLALAIVALAAALATALPSRWVRWFTGPVLVLAGAGSAAAALGAYSDPLAASRSAVARATGITGGEILVEPTSWPLGSLLPAAAVAAVGVIVLLVGGRWQTRSRFRSAAVTVAADPAEDPAAAWDALTRGEDPTRSADEDLDTDDDVAQ